MHTLSHLSSHSVALHDPKNRRCPSIDISRQFPWLPLWRAGYASKLRSVFGPALELRLLSIKRGGASLVGSFRNVPARGQKGGVVRYNGFREKETHPTKLMILKCFILKEGFRSPECALMREEFLIWSSVRWCVAVICRATATVKECLWCWLVWVLLSILLSQRFVIQRLCEWCPRAHLASSWL